VIIRSGRGKIKRGWCNDRFACRHRKAAEGGEERVKMLMGLVWGRIRRLNSLLIKRD